MIEANEFPPGLDAEQVREIIRRYDSLNEEEMVAEIEAAFEMDGQTVLVIPTDLVPKVRALLSTER